MVRRLLATGLLALVLAAPAAAQPRILWPGVTFDTGVQFTPNGPVAINILSGPRPGGTTTLAPSLSNDTLTGTGDADRDRAAHRAAGDDRRHQWRLLRVRDGPAERRPHAGRAGDEPAVRLSRERRRHLRRHARRPQGHALRHLAGARRQAHPEPVQQAARGQRHRALHAGVGAGHAAEARRGLGDPVPVPGRDAEHRPPGSGRRAAHGRRCGADPARWRRTRRRRLGRSGRAHGGGTRRADRDDAAQPQARLAGHRLRDRRRPADRSRRRPDLQGGRDLHDEPARPARAAERGRPARRRQDDPGHGRRPPARVLDRDDELRARPGARPARRGDRDGARQRRLGDDGVRRHAPEPAVRARAPDLDRPALPVHRRLRAAGRGGRLAGRRRRRATSRASGTRSCGPRPSR